MAQQDDAPSDLAKNILKNIIPLDTFEKMSNKVDTPLQSVLRLIGLGQPQVPQGGNGFVPPQNMPLPQRDPRTGQMIYPQGYTGPR